MRSELRDALLAEGVSRMAKELKALEKTRTAVQHLLACPDTVNFKVTARVFCAADSLDDPDTAHSETAENKDLQNAIREVNRALKPTYQAYKTHEPEGWKPEVIYEVWCQAGPNVLLPVPEEHWERWKYWL
jgi:hypothetical protein